jgi:hypothetical protein
MGPVTRTAIISSGTRSRIARPASNPPATIDHRSGFGTELKMHFGVARTPATFRIVGEDEADPVKGSISHISPLARGAARKARRRQGPGRQGPGRDHGHRVAPGKSNFWSWKSRQASPTPEKCRHRSVHRVPLDESCRACAGARVIGIKILSRATVPPVRERGRNAQTRTAATAGQAAPCAGAWVGNIKFWLRAICLRRVAPRAGAPIEINKRN